MNAKEKLINALYEILSNKEFIDINVSEICLVANCHRTTFYAYYSNVLELLEDAKNQAIKDFREKNQDYNVDVNTRNEKLVLNYLYFVKEHASLFKAYFKNNLALNAEEDFNLLFEKVILPKAKEKYGDNEKMIYYITRFFIDGFFSIIKIWMKNSFKESPEEIAEFVNRIQVI